jgi:outer membrane lipoprotein carrier protein
MFKTVVCLLLMVVITICIPSTVVGDEATGENVLAGLQGWLDGTTTLAGRFEQFLHSGALGSDDSEQGMMYVHRPGKMRWDYTDPEIKTALLIGRRTFLYLEEDEQLIKGVIDDESDLLPNLLAGSGRLADMFDTELLASPGEHGSLSFHLRLRPRGDRSPFEAVILELAPDDFSIESVEVLDGAGDRMEYRFDRLRRNVRLPDRIFEFEPPPGTEIAGEH